MQTDQEIIGKIGGHFCAAPTQGNTSASQATQQALQGKH